MGRVSLLLAAFLLCGAAGCSDEGGGQCLKPFAVGGVPITSLDLVVGQSDNLKARLCQAASDKTYVDIENLYKDVVSTDPEGVLVYKEGDKSQQVTIRGLKPSGGPVDIKFTLRDTSESRTVRVSVTSQGSYDFGPPTDGPTPTPDTTPSPDGPVQTDTGPTPDAPGPDA